jgi:hypothetical protein
MKAPPLQGEFRADQGHDGEWKRRHGRGICRAAASFNSHSPVPRNAKKTVQANLPATVEHRSTLPPAPAHRKRKQALLRAAAAPMRSSVER